MLDGAAADRGGPRTMAFLDKCEKLIPWGDLARSVGDVFARSGRGEAARGGRPHWPLVLYVKCMMLQKWFDVSDPQLEEQLRDRISFRRFVGLGLAEPTPDETSLVVFRRRLREAGHEHPFAWMRNMGYRKVRYRGLARNALDFGLLAAAYNLKRSFSLRGM